MASMRGLSCSIAVAMFAIVAAARSTAIKARITGHLRQKRLSQPIQGRLRGALNDALTVGENDELQEFRFMLARPCKTYPNRSNRFLRAAPGGTGDTGDTKRDGRAGSLAHSRRHFQRGLAADCAETLEGRGTHAQGTNFFFV